MSTGEGQAEARARPPSLPPMSRRNACDNCVLAQVAQTLLTALHETSLPPCLSPAPQTAEGARVHPQRLRERETYQRAATAFPWKRNDLANLRQVECRQR